MLTNEDKHQILESFLEIIEGISNKKNIKKELVFCFDQKELGLAEINPDMDLHPMIACEEDRAVEVMSEERIKEYLRDTIKILKERAREAKKAADNPKAHQSAEFNAAYLRAYYKVISTMKSWAPLYGIDLKEINLDDIDPEAELT